MLPHNTQMEASSGWVRKLGFRPDACTPEVLWEQSNSPVLSILFGGMDKYVHELDRGNKTRKKNLACSLSIATTNKQTIGLMGGSFNPAHSGHRLISELAIKRLGLNKVWWLVSPQNPLKLSAGMANIEERVQTAIKISRNPKIKVMTIRILSWYPIYL